MSEITVEAVERAAARFGKSRSWTTVVSWQFARDEIRRLSVVPSPPMRRTKQIALYIAEHHLYELLHEAQRFEQPLGWILEYAWSRSEPTLLALATKTEVEAVTSYLERLWYEDFVNDDLKDWWSASPQSRAVLALAFIGR
jgi:hypothetical protein